MKTCLFILFLIFTFTTAVCAEDFPIPTIDFTMHNRIYDVFIRDHFRFNEPKPLQIEYNYTKWLDSKGNYDEFADHILIETDLPIYKSKKILVDIPFSYSRLPIWSEGNEILYGATISTITPSILSRFIITDKFRSILGVEYTLKGNSGAELSAFGKSKGRMICIPNLVLSYDLFNQLNIMAGGRIERYYYDTNDNDYAMELSNRLYLRPIAMLNFHPSDNFAILLGFPYLGGYVSLFNGIIKADARANLNKNFEAGFKIRPINKTHLTFRLSNTPYKEIPIEGFLVESGELLDGRLEHTRKTVSFEAGRELNPAAIVSLNTQYSPESDVDFTANSGKEYNLDGKPHYTIGVKFTVDIEALLQLK
ncbi:TPA: hypothetical protein ENS27_07865 [bacterium]|nr:hypothetical protein [bacterium]